MLNKRLYAPSSVFKYSILTKINVTLFSILKDLAVAKVNVNLEEDNTKTTKKVNKSKKVKKSSPSPRDTTIAVVKAHVKMEHNSTKTTKKVNKSNKMKKTSSSPQDTTIEVIDLCNHHVQDGKIYAKIIKMKQINNISQTF